MTTCRITPVSILLFAVCFSATARPTEAATIYVRADATGANDGTSWDDAYADLQDALVLAEGGDEIWVAAGNYTPADPGGSRDASFQLVADIALYGGFAGWEALREDRNWETNETVLSGDLDGDDGSEFLNNDENSYHVITTVETLSSCVVDGFTITAGNSDGDDFPDNSGGGLHIAGGTTTVSNSVLTLNTGSYGGAAYNSSESTAAFNTCDFVENAGRFVGAGLYNDGGELTTKDCFFGGNLLEAGGGSGGAAVKHKGGTLDVDTCFFIDNNADAAISIDGGTVTLARSVFSNNANAGHGAIYTQFCDLVITHCIFLGNESGVATVGGCCGNILVQNSTFSGDSGTALSFNDSSSTLTVLNSTVTHNLDGGINKTSLGLTVSNSILWGNSIDGTTDENAQIHTNDDDFPLVTYCCIQGLTGDLGGAGNIGLDPLLLNSIGDDGVPGTDDDDLRLSPESPCIDAGDNDSLPVDHADLDGDGNVGEATPFDLDGSARQVDVLTAKDTGNGAGPLVDMGAYETKEFEGAIINVPGDFSLIQTAINVAQLGVEIVVAPGLYPEVINFFGKAVTLRSSAGADATIIDGTGLDDSVVKCISGEGPDTVLDGFTITGGDSDSGGGMRNIGSSPTIKDCLFIANTAPNGGGVYFGGGSARMDNCKITGNSVTGIWCADFAAVTINNCLFTENSADAGGGIHCRESSIATINNCTFTDNTANHGAVHTDAASLIITNSILWGNNSAEEIWSSGGESAVYYSNVGIVVGPLLWGDGNIDADPLFVDSENDDFRLLPGSPCIDAADNDVLPADMADLDGDGDVEEPVPFDLAGNTRQLDDGDTEDTGNGIAPIVDMGAHEFGFADCNGNGIDDGTDIANGTSDDCNLNFVPDECDVASGASEDCNGNTLPDECEDDCNVNGFPDDCDISSGTSEDCDTNGLPDDCDLANGTSTDCQLNDVPDECDIDSGTSQDCNNNGLPDDCDIANGTSIDCQVNGVPDTCDIAAGTSDDCDDTMVPDECEMVGVVDLIESSGALAPFGSDSPQSHEFTDLPEPIGDVLLSFTARGDFDGLTELASIELNGSHIGDILADDGEECPEDPQERDIVLTMADFVELAPDGIALVDMIPSDAVNSDCGALDSFISVTMAYEYIGTVNDCNDSGTLDSCDLAAGTSTDCQGNGVLDDCETLPQLVSASSCVVHADAGELCLDLALDDLPTIEPRLGGGAKLVLVFDLPVDPTRAEDSTNIFIDRCTGGVIEPENIFPVLDESETVLTITFDTLPDGQLADGDCYTVDVSAFCLDDDADFGLTLLAGDANRNGAVDPLDSGAVLARFGCPVEDGDPDCFTSDINNDGATDPLDSGAVLARFGSSACSCE